MLEVGLIDYKMGIKIVCIAILGAVLSLGGCIEVPEEPLNPFDKYLENPNLMSGDSTFLPEGSFAQIHRDIFKPTCANSGCHDGHFEPDFRSIESSYNTLVHHPVVKNDIAGTYQYRVNPFAVDSSLLWARLNRDIDGQSGIMPLVVDPDNDWSEKRDKYLEQVRVWIEAGAPDVFGNIPKDEGINPYVRGLVGALTVNSSVYLRDAGNGGLLIPRPISLLQLWFSIYDGEHMPSEINAKMYLSTEVDSDKEVNGIPLLTVDERTEPGFEGEAVLHSHRGSFMIDTFDIGKSIFIHLKVLDPDTGKLIRIPAKDSPDYIKEIFSFKRY